MKCDAQLEGYGATFWQRRGNLWVLCRIISKAFSKIESRGSATEREGLGIIRALLRWRKIIFKPLLVVTDHIALIHIFGVNAQRTKNAKLIRMRLLLSGFQITLVHIPGKKLVFEDYLSRYIDVIAEEVLQRDGISIKMDDKGEMINPFQDEKGNKINDKEKVKENLKKLYNIELIECTGYMGNDNDKEFEFEINNISADMDICSIKHNLNKFMDQANTIDLLGKPQGNNISVQGHKNGIYLIGTTRDNEYEDHHKDYKFQDEVLFDKHLIESTRIENAPKHAILDNPMRFGVNAIKEVRNEREIQELNKYNTNELQDIYEIKQGIDRLIARSSGTLLLGQAYEGTDQEDIRQRVKELSNYQIQERNLTTYLKEYKKTLPEERINHIKLLIKELNDKYNSLLARIANINQVETRLQKRAKRDKEYRDLLNKYKFKPGKTDLLATGNGKLFRNEKDPLKLIYDAQRNEFDDILQELLKKRENYSQFNIFNKPYVKYFKDNRIGCNKNGLLCIDKKILLPTELRTDFVFYYHTSQPGGHRGIDQIGDIIKQRVTWIGIDQDIKIIIKSCPCSSAKICKKGNAGYKDKGLRTQQYSALDFNDLVYMDMYGPIYDGERDNHAITMIDFFSAYIRSDLLLPLYAITALGIIKWIIFEWI